MGDHIRVNANRYAREYKATLKAAGLCPNCKGTPDPGHVYCRKCLAWFARYNKTNKRAKYSWKRMRQRRVNRGVCGLCGKRPLDLQTMCRPCADRKRQQGLKYRKTTKKLRCSMCGELGHQKRSCPLRFRVDIVHYGTMRHDV
jgi:hypothetical protein